MNFQNVRLRPLLCAVLSVILVTGSMILPAFAAEQNVNFSYVDSVPSATVAPALWKLAGCSESLPASSAQTVLNERVGAAVDGYISSDKKAFILNHDYPGELNKCEAYSNCYVTRVLDDDRNRYDVCAFSDGAVEFKIDSNGYFCWGSTSDAKLIYTSGVKSDYHTAWRNGLVGDMTFSKVFPCASSFGTTKQGTGSLVFGEGLRSNGSIASSLDDEIYAGWTGKAISVSDSQTIYLPISVSDTIAGTGSLTQDVAQAGTTYYPGAVEETDEELPIVDVPVVGADLLGIITLLKSILQVLINIYRVVSSNISSWWDNATTTIALNIASLGSSIETWWAAATETIMGGITDAVTSITKAISTAIADVVTWLKSVAATLSDILEWAKGLPAAISQAISTAIADVIEWLKSLGATLADILEWIKSLPSAIVDGISSVLTSIFVPTTDFITAKVESLRARFDWIDPFIVFAENISGELFSTEPPVIYIHLDDAEGSYNYTARSPGTAARPFRGFPISFSEIRPWPRCCACWQRSFSWN